MNGGMRFGLLLPQGWRVDLVGIDPAKHWDTVLGTARRADHGPWQSVSVYDHFHTIPIPTDEATHEAWTLMAALAASTRRIRLGQMADLYGRYVPADQVEADSNPSGGAPPSARRSRWSRRFGRCTTPA